MVDGMVAMAGASTYFWKEDHLFVTPNAKGPPPAAFAELELSINDPPSAQESLKLRLSSNKYPFLGFVMVKPRYSHILLQRLNYTFNNLPVSVQNREWVLDGDLVRQWAELECSLIEITNFLFNRFQVMLPVDVDFFPFPSSYGFAHGRPNEVQMRKVAMKARAAFGPLMALCSYMIALTPSFTIENPPWAASLSDIKGSIKIPPAWLTEFCTCSIADFTIGNPRVGVVFTPDCQFLEYVPNFVRANVPVWILWTQSEWYSKVPTVKRYCPPTDDVRHAYLNRAIPQEETPCAYDVGDIGPLEVPPDVERNSRQIKGESPEVFFARRDRDNRITIAKETAAACQARRQREAAARGHQMPGSRGAMVFIWEQEGSFWIRRALGRQHVPAVWPDIPDKTRRYDGFSDEWDVYPMWDAPAVMDGEMHDATHSVVGASEEPAASPPQNAILHHLPSVKADYSRDLGEAYRGRKRNDEPHVIEGLEAILKYRYGYKFCLCGPDQAVKRIKAAQDWNGARKVLCDLTSLWKEENLQDCVINFVNYALTSRVPSALWDFDLSSDSPINPNGEHVRVVRLQNRQSVKYEIVPTSSIIPPGGEAPWRLLVDDPLTALECVRRSTSQLSKQDYVSFFLDTGRPFSTQAFVHPPPPPRLPPAKTRYSQGGLGTRPAQYNATNLDYLAYEAKRDVFLLCDRARAAVMKGGIVWRLTVHSVNPDIVLYGPVDLGSGVYSRNDGEIYGSWDDELTEDELDLVVGVYKGTEISRWMLLGGRSTTFGEIAPSILDTGVLPHRLQKIRENGTQLKTAAEWREALKLNKPARRFTDYLSDKAAHVFPDCDQ
ncbi:hypothetical protein HWV62_22357 [Athelia sp. TMB]|nr:hypothetical protein HWV62_22357 [Athelia sp. TMB]